MLIGGTFYAGEIKKSIFTVMNDRLPLEGVLPMHCSANVGDDGHVAVFFGLSGTGKTTLSADPERWLIGDDEHGWSDSGDLQHRGRLLREGDPALGGRRARDLRDDAHVRDDPRERRRRRARRARPRRRSKTENTRAAYKLEQISNALPEKRAGHPSSVVMLTADAFGDPAADRAADARPGALLLPLRLHGEARRHRDRRHRAAADVLDVLRRAVPAAAAGVYARMLGEKLDAHDVDVWLVNTGWTGGPFGEGQRMPIAATRALLHAALSGELDDVEYRTDDVFGFEVPIAGAGRRRRAPRPALDVARPEAYDGKARELARDVPRELREVRGRRAAEVAAAGRAATRCSAAFAVASDLVEAKHDVLVVGAGCAGMRAAIEAHDAGADVGVISKLHPTRSHSGAAEGGINAALGNAAEDDPEMHAFDTVKGSDYLGDQDAIEILCREAPDDIYQLEHWGAFFSRREDGRLAQRPFGAAGSPRTVYAADITGHVLIQVLYEQVCRRDITVYEEFFAWQLVLNDDRCQGVICWDLLNGGAEDVGGKTVVLATGGAGASTARRRTRTPAPATGWRWRCARACR